MFETFYINDDIKIMLFYPRQVYKHFVEVSRAVLLQRIWKKFVRNNGARVRPLFWHLLLPKRAKQVTCTLITVWILNCNT